MSERGCEAGVTVADAVAWAIRLLSVADSESARLDAQVLLGYILGMSRTQIHTHWQQCLSAGEAQQFTGLVQRRAQHEPVAYLVGERAFYDVTLRVDRRVLVPRPETELLVEEALRWGNAAPAGARRVADVGTGSGALAVTLARCWPKAHVVAVDISPAALAVAAGNVHRYGLDERIDLVCSDLIYFT